MLHLGLLTGGETLKCSRKRIMQGAILTNLATAQKNMASAEKVDAGQQNTPATIAALLALNLLCGLYFKEASSHEKI